MHLFGHLTACGYSSIDIRIMPKEFFGKLSITKAPEKRSKAALFTGFEQF
jgi:hypothetical protein